MFLLVEVLTKDAISKRCIFLLVKVLTKDVTSMLYVYLEGGLEENGEKVVEMVETKPNKTKQTK